VGQDLCGKWMPRKRTMCARTPGHGGSCKTAEVMERQREYSRAHPHRESKESRKKSNRKYRISSYGLTQEQAKHDPWPPGKVAGVPNGVRCHRPGAV
jgi:hypothetical protein